MNFNHPRISYILQALLLLIIIWGCETELIEKEKYQPPEWLKGKLYSQIQKEEDLTTFISCLEKTGYDTILNASGSFTVFAPTDEAFDQFLQAHPEYKVYIESPESSKELEALLEYQIIYNSWSKRQFQSSDVNGWIDPDDKLDEPRAYKRLSLLREKNKTYPVRNIGEDVYVIADSSESDESLVAYTQSNKYCPIFYGGYLNIHDLTGKDYEFYFDRSFDAGDLYFAGAKLGEEIPAENGFIYKTDRVIAPLPNGEEILSGGDEDYSYNKFHRLIKQFSEFEYNREATLSQVGADEGLEVDELYNLDYPDLVFNISNELTGNTNNSKFTYREHHGLLAPTDQAMDHFMDNYLSRFEEYDRLPSRLKQIIINSHMTDQAVYQTDINQGFLNGEMDRVHLNEQDIVQKTYGSNCSFLGLNKAIVPRVLTSICRPLFLTDDYETLMYAAERTKVLAALKRKDINYTFYLPRDEGIGTTGDSSLIRVVTNPDLDRYHFEAWNRGQEQMERVNDRDLRNKILHQITTASPEGIADKEFLRNLGGKYIIVNNREGTISGTDRNTFGYNGDSTITLKPERIDMQMDNGEVYAVDSWFNFSGSNYQGIFASKYPEFLDLMTEAGLYDPILYEFPFLVDGENYTVFIPSTQALNDYGVDDMSKQELNQFLRYHFVREDLIFTDGRKPEGNYSTTCIEESSTSYRTHFSQIHIRPTPDIIQILDKNGGVYLEVPEQEGETNQIIWYDTNDQSSSDWDFITTGVIHNIDKVLIRDSLQSK